MRKWLIIMAVAAIVHNPAQAGYEDVDSSIFVEHIEGNGADALRRLEFSESFASGDRVVTILRWQATAKTRNGLIVTSAIPNELRFNRASGNVSVSTDGGANFRQDANFSGRVTHLRWRIDARAARQGRGQVSYRATVR